MSVLETLQQENSALRRQLAELEFHNRQLENRCHQLQTIAEKSGKKATEHLGKQLYHVSGNEYYYINSGGNKIYVRRT